jgi:hypothetical protein
MPADAVPLILREQQYLPGIAGMSPVAVPVPVSERLSLAKGRR